MLPGGQKHVNGWGPDARWERRGALKPGRASLPLMEDGLGQYASQIGMMLLGGLITSFGAPWLARKPRGREMMLNVKGWGIALFVVLTSSSFRCGGGSGDTLAAPERRS